MPAKVSQIIRHDNLKFLKNRDVYDKCYFEFIYNLVNEIFKTAASFDGQDNPIYTECLKLSVYFLYNTYFRTKKSLRIGTEDWKSLIENIFSVSKASCLWMGEFLSKDTDRYLTPFLLKCPSLDTRQMYSKILQHFFCCWFKHSLPAIQSYLDTLLQNILNLLDKEVLTHAKNASTYFEFLYSFVSIGTKACSLLHQYGALNKLVSFLMGDTLSSPTLYNGIPPLSPSSPSTRTRRWSSIQVRDFEYLHCIIAIIVLHYDVQPYQTEGTSGKQFFPLKTATPKPLLRMGPDIVQIVFEKHSSTFINEMLLGLKDVDQAEKDIRNMLLYCSFCNRNFWDKLMMHLLKLLSEAPVNELKRLLVLLEHLMKLKDSSQIERIIRALEGCEPKYAGVLTIMKDHHVSEPRRTYQLIKCISRVADECNVVRNQVQNVIPKWHWAVNWLKQKMSNKSFGVSSHSVDSNELGTARSFQRTVSAQHTLEGATALLESINDCSDMEINDDDTIPLSSQNTISSFDDDKDTIPLGSEDLD